MWATVLDTMGIQNPAETKGSAPRAPAQPSQPAQTDDAAKQTAAAGTPAKRVSKAPNPKTPLKDLSELLESHNELLSMLGVGKHALQVQQLQPRNP